MVNFMLAANITILVCSVGGFVGGWLISNYIIEKRWKELRK